jgi:hypothetical protein
MMELKYKPAPMFVDKRGYILKEIEDKWGYRRFENDRIEFKDDEDYNHGRITWKHSFINMEDIYTSTNFADRLNNTLGRRMWEKLEVNKFMQVKCSIRLIQEITDYSFKEMVNLNIRNLKH